MNNNIFFHPCSTQLLFNAFGSIFCSIAGSRHIGVSFFSVFGSLKATDARAAKKSNFFMLNNMKYLTQKCVLAKVHNLET